MAVQGDAFPYEKARIIAEMELSMPQADLDNVDLFPRWLHALEPKSGSEVRAAPLVPCASAPACRAVRPLAERERVWE